MIVACVKLKIILPNIAVRGGSRTPAVSKMELFMAMTLKAFNFCRRELDLKQTLACNLDPRPFSKI